MNDVWGTLPPASSREGLVDEGGGGGVSQSRALHLPPAYNLGLHHTPNVPFPHTSPHSPPPIPTSACPRSPPSPAAPPHPLQAAPSSGATSKSMTHCLARGQRCGGGGWKAAAAAAAAR